MAYPTAEFACCDAATHTLALPRGWRAHARVQVGLGWLGVVTEVTLQCVPAHKLLQHTFVETREGIRKRCAGTRRAARTRFSRDF